MYAYLLYLALAYPHYPTGTAAQIEVWNAGYEARWTEGKARTANPYLRGTWQRETWDDSWGSEGWMPDLRELYEVQN